MDRDRTSVSTGLFIAAALVLGACEEPSAVSGQDAPACAPLCGKADGADHGGRDRLRDLPDAGWPAPLDVEPIVLPSDALTEGMHAQLRNSPSLTAFQAAQRAIRVELGDESLEIEDFGPEVWSAVHVPAWGDVALPALVASTLDDDAPIAGANASGSITADPVALLDAAAMSRDPVGYAEVVRQVSVNPALPESLRARAWAYLHETVGRGGRYRADATMRTLDDVAPVALAEAVAAMLDSASSRDRRNGLVGAAQYGLLSPSVVDAALADPSFLVRMDAATYFFAGSDVSEARQAAFLAEIDDPEFVAQVRLDVIRSMGWSELSEGLFAPSPKDMAERLQVYRATVVGEMLRTAPAEVPIAPVAELAPAFADVDPIVRDLVDALRRSTVYSDEERFWFVEPLLDLHGDALETPCTYAIELLWSEDATPDMAEGARRCFSALENGSSEVRRQAFADAWPGMTGTVDERRAALTDLLQTPGWNERAWVGAALLRRGALPEDEREAVVRDLVADFFWLRHSLLEAYVDGGGSADTVVELLRRYLGWVPGAAQPSRGAELYHHAASLLVRAGVHGDALAETLAQILATEPGHAFPLWRVFLTGAPGFRDDGPIVELIWLLGHPSISDEALVEAIHRILVPGGEVVDRQVLKYFTEAGVDPHFLAVANTALRADDPSRHAATYFGHVVPGVRRPDVDLDLTRSRIDAVRTVAAERAGEIPADEEIDAWLGSDSLHRPVPTAAEALARVTELGSRGLDEARDTLEALMDLTYAPDVQDLPEDDVAAVRELLTSGAWAGTDHSRAWEAKFGLMILDCQRRVGYRPLRERYRDTIGVRWDLADAVADAQGEQAALQTLLEAVGSDYDAARITSSLAEVCSVGAPLAEDARFALIAEALAHHSDLNGTYNGDVLQAVLTHEDLDLARFHDAMLRRAHVMVSWFDGIDPVFARWVGSEAVPAEQGLELLALAASLSKVDPRPRRDFPSLVRAYVGREDLDAGQRTEALALVAWVRTM